jgi:protein-disulfide isomerase
MSRLNPPVGPGDHVLGDPDAPVTLVEYGDYECPYCGRAHTSVKEVLRRMGPEVRYTYRHFPLAEVHPHALQAAEAAEAAGRQGQFWPMHDMLFRNQNALEYEDLLGYAEVLGLDTARFASELESHAHLNKVRSDFHSGVRSGVNGTPTFFVDGGRFDGNWAPDTLIAALRRAIRMRGRGAEARP